jgi:tetratricopeptide (TPR) repeat protein
MATDCFGNAVTLDSESSRGPLDDFVEGFVASEARALNVLEAAGHDMSPIVQACAAAVHMFSESREAPTNARPFIERAQSRANKTMPREQRFIAAVAAWIDGDIPRAMQLHEEQAKEFPRDLSSLKLGQYHLFNAGDSDSMLRIAMHAWDAARDLPWYHGMLAFGFEQCHRLQEAEAAARRAIALRRKEPWAHHALAHVMLTQGRIREGHEFLADVSDTWTGLNSFMVTHNWWHQGLFALELGEYDEALALYDRQVWGVAKDYTQDQINAVSLLARLELSGVGVGERWADVGKHLASRLDDHVLPFLDVQYLYGLARAGRPEADTLMRNIEQFAQRAPAHSKAAWHEVALPAAHGLLAHARRDYARAAQELDRALPRMIEIGGSHAQRDLFARIHRDAVARR